MKKIIKQTMRLAKMAAAVLVAVALAALAPDAHATGSTVYFYATNVLQGATTYTNITSWPTNQQATNGIGQQTGKAVNLGNYNHFQFVAEGYLTNSTLAYVGVTLLTASSASTPVVDLPTNGVGLATADGGVARNDWSTPTIGANPNGGVASGGLYLGGTSTNGGVIQITIPVPALTNWFHYETNITYRYTLFTSGSASNYVADTPFQDAEWVGIYCITNNFAAGMYWTNANSALFGIHRKLIPTPLIGNQ